MKAYNIEIVPQSVHDDAPRGQGWCFGPPPGIKDEQWPLDRNNGYPLAHGFTLLLPEDYRVHGPDIVALSFFATAHNDGGSEEVAEIAAILKDGAQGSEPRDPDLYTFWMAERLKHPRMHRMEDLLGCSYAVILLTQKEFDGPFCQPPRLRPNKYRDRIARPEWLDIGAAAAFAGGPSSPLSPENSGLFRMFGEEPRAEIGYNRALSLTARAEDPNAGIAPSDEWSARQTSYQPPYFWQNDVVEDENYREHAWAADHLQDHIGGTMRPAQGIPEISPYYIEFEEYLGGYNFGGGNAWLDLESLTFDWAQ